MAFNFVSQSRKDMSVHALCDSPGFHLGFLSRGGGGGANATIPELRGEQRL